MAKNRNYSAKDIDMLIAAKIIIEHFIANINELSLVRTNWTLEYANTLAAEIDDAIENKLGTDAKKELRQASADLYALMIPAKRDIAFFKVQLGEDFKQNKDRFKELLNLLGFTKHLHNIQNDDQEALIQFLYTFKANIDDTLAAEITQKGMNPALITKITGYAETVKQADVIQENTKGTSKEITDENKEVFNKIYDDIIAICKTASKYYQYDPVKKEQFTFAKIISNMNFKKTNPETPEE